MTDSASAGLEQPAKLRLTYETRVDSRGRVVVRKTLREAMGLPAGGPVEWFMNEEGDLALRAAVEEANDD